MSKQKKNTEKKKVINQTTKANGKTEYYISKSPSKTVAGKIVIWVLVALMALASLGSLIIALIQLSK